MTAITWTNVTDVARELLTTPPAAQLMILSQVNGRLVNVENFGGEEHETTKTARILLAAHMGTMIRRRGVAGGISSQSEGGVSQSYAVNLADPRSLDQTSYGQLLRMLTMGSPARAGQLVTGS